MHPLLITILIVLGVINITAFLVMLFDKIKARNSQERISEGALFFLAICFGGIGVYFGMFLCHHKTRKWYFYFGIPLLILQNMACLYLIYQYLVFNSFIY